MAVTTADSPLIKRGAHSTKGRPRNKITKSTSTKSREKTMRKASPPTEEEVVQILDDSPSPSPEKKKEAGVKKLVPSKRGAALPGIETVGLLPKHKPVLTTQPESTWKAKYNTLVDIRLTQPEQNLKDLQNAFEERQRRMLLLQLQNKSNHNSI